MGEKRREGMVIFWPSVEAAIAAQPGLGARGRPTALALAYKMVRPADESESLEARIESRIHKEPDDGCWVWTGGIHSRRPLFHPTYAESIRVRDWVFHHVTGKDGVDLHPICGRNTCVKPEHQARRNGQISILDAERIRRRWALHLAHKTSLVQIGREHGVSKQRIEQIVRDVEPVPCTCQPDVPEGCLLVKE